MLAKLYSQAPVVVGVGFQAAKNSLSTMQGEVIFK